MPTKICRGCGQPLNRDWAPTDPTLADYHAGCRPGAGRVPYRAPRVPTADPFDTGDPERDDTLRYIRALMRI